MIDRIGVLFSRADDLELVSRAEQLGYESVWAAEGQGRSGFGKLERWATATDDIGLATGIVNVYSRSPAAMAQSIATLDAHSGGRAILGLGVAHPGVVEDFHGMSFERPLARMAEYITLVRRYLKGEATAFEGEFFSPTRTSFWDAFEPERAEIPIYNAALGAGNVRLTGELADGWLPNLFPTARMEEGRAWLRTGADRAGRDVDEIDVAMYLLVAVDDDPSAARQRVAKHVATYLRDVPGFYDRVAARAGFEAAVERAKAADTTAAAAKTLPREFLEVVGVIGTAEEVRTEIASARDAGVNLPIVRAPIGADRSEQAALLEACAPV